MCCPDNYDMFLIHEAEQEVKLSKLPTCSECNKPIQEEECYMFDNKLICIHCLEENHEKKTDDFIEE